MDDTSTFNFLLKFDIACKTHHFVVGLPPTGSWQDLKDHMREAGDVCFADVYKDGTGACEYVRYEDMKYALKKLDDTKFKSHEVSINDRISFNIVFQPSFIQFLSTN